MPREYVRKSDSWEREWHSSVEESALNVPASPTSALPGSREKVAVMARRHEDGERLHHPDDPVIDWSPEADGADEVTAGKSPHRRERVGAKHRRKVGYW